MNGIIITVVNTNEASIEDTDLLLLVNELRRSGAEAISINDQRVINMSEIRTVGNFILINGTRITSPYIIKAIGDSAYLESGLTIKGGYIDALENNEIEVTIERVKNIKILKYNGNISSKYINIVQKEDDE